MKRIWILIPFILIGMLLIPSIIWAEKTDELPIRVIVMFQENVDPYSVVTEDDVQLELEIINGVAMMATPAKIKTLKNRDDVKSITMDNPIKAAESTPYTRLPWGVNRMDADMVWNHVDPDTSVGNGVTGDGIHVAVLDTGIDLDHPDLVSNIGTGINYVQTVNPRGKVMSYDPTAFDDDNGHGTHCAGIIAGDEANVGNGMIGVARDATVHPVKVLDKNGNGYTSWLVSGIQWCVDDGNIDVISMSLSSTSSDPNVETACNVAESEEIILVAAAGNYGDGDLDTDEIEYPASYSSVISVGATDRHDVLAEFSSSSPYVEVAGPGVDIYSTYMGDGYATMSGTSMACPHVAGTVALMLESGIPPISDNEEVLDVRDKLTSLADDIGVSGWDSGSGAGLVDALIACGFDDNFAPMIIEVSSVVTDDSATISFLTDEPATAGIEYWAEGETTHSDSSDSIDKIYHSIYINDLEEGTKYFYQISAVDLSNNLGGEERAENREFTTTGGVTPPPDEDAMHVKDISVTTSTKGANKYIATKVLIVDSLGVAVGGATVTLEITLGSDTISTSSSVTGSDGYASFSQKVKSTGIYTIVVTGVVKTGWIYDSSSDEVTSAEAKFD